MTITGEICVGESMMGENAAGDWWWRLDCTHFELIGTKENFASKYAAIRAAKNWAARLGITVAGVHDENKEPFDGG